MNNQKKVKALISFLILIVITLFVVSIFQIVNINKTKNKLIEQEKQIERLEQELDYHKNKNPNDDYEVIS